MVSKLKIDPGNCKFLATVTAKKISGKELEVCLETSCKNLETLKNKIKTVKMNDYAKIMVEPIPHCICPIPLGIIKACEAEFGLGLKKDMKYEFEK
jgi:hypothetical protein